QPVPAGRLPGTASAAPGHQLGHAAGHPRAPRGRQADPRRVWRHALSAGATDRSGRQRCGPGRVAARPCGHAETTGDAGSTGRRTAGRKTAWPHVPPLGAGLCVGAAGVGRVPELSAHPRGGVPRGPSDRLLYTSIYAFQSPGRRRAVPARQAGSGMSVAVAALAGMTLDAWLGEVRRWHPLVGFGRLAHAIEQRLNGPQGKGSRIAGVLGWSLVVLPLVTLAALCSHLLGFW